MKRLRIAGIAISMVLFCAAVVWAQTATVAGSVTDRNGRPVVKATVSIGEKFAFTDSNGRFRIKDTPFGRHALHVEKGGRVLSETPIEIDDAQKVMNIQLP